MMIFGWEKKISSDELNWLEVSLKDLYNRKGLKELQRTDKFIEFKI